MRLKDFITDSGLSIAAFGRRMGIENRPTITRYVTGQRLADPETIERIRKATDGAVTADDLVDECLEHERQPHSD